MKTAEIGDIAVAYSERGSAAEGQLPLVFVHGLAEARGTWEHTQDDLQRHTFAYDLRGHGDTPIGDADGTLDQLGNDLLGFLEQITGPAIVIGFSLGGTVALWAAAQRADLVPHAIVLGTSSVVGRQALDFYRQRIELATDTSSEEFQRAILDDTAAGLASASERLYPVTELRLLAIGDGAGYVNASRAMMALNNAPLTPKLAAVKGQVDIVGADHDSFCPDKAARIIVDALGGATRWQIPHAGHLMNVDNPASVTSTLQQILSS